MILVAIFVWLLAILLVATLIAVILAVGLRGIRKDQHGKNPLEKESNYWW